MPGEYEKIEIAENYDKFSMKYPAALPRTVMEYLRKINPGEKTDSQRFDLMLDAGCGPGVSARLFGPYFESIIGFDISEAQLKKAKKYKDENIHYVVASGESMPAEDKTVDLITSAWSLQYMDLNRFVGECNRVLKSTGCAVIYAFEYVGLKLDPSFPGNCVSGLDILHGVVTQPLAQYLVNICHADRCSFDRFNEIYDSITGIKKERNEKEDDIVFEVELSLEDLMSHLLCVPIFKKYSESSDGKEILPEFARRLKKLWNVEDHQNRNIPTILSLSIFMIYLRPSDGK